MENEARLRQEQLWNQPPVQDVHWTRRRNVSEAREHGSLLAFVKGQRWYAQNLFTGRVATDSRAASRDLISSSRRLLTESRQLITRTRNTLIFSRSRKQMVN